MGASVSYWATFSIAVGAVIVFVSASTLVLKYSWKTPSRARRIFPNLVLVITSLAVLGLCTEVVFKEFVALTDGFGFTHAARNWHERYWGHVNSRGYRDRDWNAADIQDKRKIYVTGDSFVAGCGIKNVKDRFPDILQNVLGDGWVVQNIATPGWATQDEYNAVTGVSPKPDILILSYFINDIQNAAIKNGYGMPPSPVPPQGLLGEALEKSYAFNFFYWRVYRSVQGSESDYLNYMYRMYNNKKAWGTHEEEMLAFCRWARENNVSLLVVIFPYSLDLKSSAPICSRVAAFFKSNGASVIDLTGELAGWDKDDLIVSRMDGHPSVKLHRYVAGRLYKELRLMSMAGAAWQKDMPGFNSKSE